MKRCIASVAAVLLISGVRGENKSGVEFMDECYPPVSVTPTNLTVNPRFSFKLSSRGPDGRSSEIIRVPANEAFAFPLDDEVFLGDMRHVHMIFTPVSFKGKQKGFRIIDMFFDSDADTTNGCWYVALGKGALIEKAAEDVEMIKEGGKFLFGRVEEGEERVKWVESEWKPFNPQPAATPDGGGGKGEREKESVAAGARPPADGPGSGDAAALLRRLWLYIVLPLPPSSPSCGLCAGSGSAALASDRRTGRTRGKTRRTSGK